MKESDPKRLSSLISNAQTTQAQQLSELALASKAYWGYDSDFIERCRSELQYQPEFIADHTNIVRVAVDTTNQMLVGFYALVPYKQEQDCAELEALFVAPEQIGLGLGKRLFIDAKQRAEEAGYRHIVIQSDPNAAPFYHNMGAVEVGQKPSGSVSNRMLPWLKYSL